MSNQVVVDERQSLGNVRALAVNGVIILAMVAITRQSVLLSTSPSWVRYDSIMSPWTGIAFAVTMACMGFMALIDAMLGKEQRNSFWSCLALVLPVTALVCVITFIGALGSATEWINDNLSPSDIMSVAPAKPQDIPDPLDDMSCIIRYDMTDDEGHERTFSLSADSVGYADVEARDDIESAYDYLDPKGKMLVVPRSLMTDE